MDRIGGRSRGQKSAVTEKVTQALGAAMAVQAGDRVALRIQNLGSVSLRFA